VRTLVSTMAQLVQEARKAQPEHEGIVIIRPDVDGSIVERLEPGQYRLRGRDVERAVALNDVTTPEALNWIDDRLKKLGVDRLLNRAGAAEGDIIWIGNFSFEYEPDL